MAGDAPGVTDAVPEADVVEDYIYSATGLWAALEVESRAVDVRFLARGAANAVFAFDVEDHALVVRVALAANTRRSRREQVGQEAEVIQALQGLDIVPRLWWVDLTSSHCLGAPLIVMQRLDGRAIDYRREDLIEVARLHARLHEASVALGGVEVRRRPVFKLLEEARSWIELYRQSDIADRFTTSWLDSAYGRCELLDRIVEDISLVHGDATYWNFLVTESGHHLIDWDWCRVSAPIADASHFLSPVTTGRLHGRQLSQGEEELYARSYVEASGRYGSVEEFFDALDAHRPAVVLHSAAWTAAWLAQSRHDEIELPPGLHDCLRPERLRWQIEPDFLNSLFDRGIL